MEAPKKIYESVIEIWLEKPEHLKKQEDEERQRARELREICSRYAEGTPRFAMAYHRWNLTRAPICLGRTGYVGGHHNCDFPTIYAVFGGDPIAFLFNQPWVPHRSIDPFKPQEFLSRLSQLESSAERLRDGDRLPILLHAAPGDENLGRPRCFSEENDRWFLTQSLKELRDFGEFGLGLKPSGAKLAAGINIFIPDGQYDTEILAYARRLEPLRGEVTEHAIVQAVHQALEGHVEGLNSSLVSIGPCADQMERIKTRLLSTGSTIDQFRAQVVSCSREEDDLLAEDQEEEFEVRIWVDHANKQVNAAVIQAPIQREQ